MDAKKKILVIAPHADDEVLGCGGYLLSESKRGSEIHIVLGTVGGQDKRQCYPIRIAEFKSVCDALNAQGRVLFDNKDAIMDTLPDREIISKLDSIVDSLRPDEIFINCTSHHQDHRKLYHAAMASMRMREGYRPKMVALYEYPCLEPGEIVDGGRCYHDITGLIDEKKSLMRLYPSQIRKAPSPINEEGIEDLASMRGRECGCKYAELFYIQKMSI